MSLMAMSTRCCETFLITSSLSTINLSEALAAGIWLERFDESSDSETVSAAHPLRALPRPSTPDLIEAHGLICEIWRNTRSMDQILEDAKLCSQKLLQFVLVVDGISSISWTLAIRVRHGKVRSSLKRSLGSVHATFAGVPGLEDVRPHIESWLREVRERRKHMGKA